MLTTGSKIQPSTLRKQFNQPPDQENHMLSNYKPNTLTLSVLLMLFRWVYCHDDNANL